MATIRLPNVRLLPSKPVVRGVPNSALLGGFLVVVAGAYYYLTKGIEGIIPSGFDQKEPTPEQPPVGPGGVVTPIPSIAGNEIPSPVVAPPAPVQQPFYPYAPINFPTPGTSSGTGGISDVPTGCPVGYVPNANGVCTPGTQLYPCPAGYARNTTNGVCEEIPITIRTGDITKVEVPSTTRPGQTADIITHFKNKSTLKLYFYVKITVTELGIAKNSPWIWVEPGQNAKIIYSLLVPANAAPKDYTAQSMLKAAFSSQTAHYQDNQYFTLKVALMPSATVTFTQTTVKRGTAFGPVTATGFTAGEQVTFVTTVVTSRGIEGIGIDYAVADNTGKASLHDMFIRADAPIGNGIATVTATGVKSGRIGTKTITLTS